MTTPTSVTETTATPETPLTSLCLSAGAKLDLELYSGMLTPRRLDAPEAETEAVLHGAAVHDLGWRCRIAVRGEDRQRWLSGMVTNTVEGLPDNSGAYNLVLNAQGRIQGDCLVWRCGEALEIEIAVDQSDALLAHFDRFIIMDDVELVPLDGLTALGLTGPKSDTLLESIGLPALPEWAAGESMPFHAAEQSFSVQMRRGYGRLVPHYSLWVERAHLSALWQTLRAAGATIIGAETIERLRIVEGIATYGVDFTSHELPQETAQTHAIHFAKGCYLGQEIVERIRSRGQVHRHLRALEIFPDGGKTAPAVATELFLENRNPNNGKPAAKLTSVTMLNPMLNHSPKTHFFALGIVRAEAEVGDTALHYQGGTARILKSPPQLS